MSVEIEKKIAVFMSDEEFDNYRKGNELISKLVEEIGKLKSEKVDRKVEICFWSKNDNEMPVIFFEENTIYFNSISDTEIAEKVALKLQQEESLLKSLVIEIQSLNSKKDALQARIDNQPKWIKWLMR